jgi:hypothetical protein
VIHSPAHLASLGPACPNHRSGHLFGQTVSRRAVGAGDPTFLISLSTACQVADLRKLMIILHHREAIATFRSESDKAESTPATMAKFRVEAAQQGYQPSKGISGNHLAAEVLGSILGQWPVGRYWTNTIYKLWGPEFMATWTSTPGSTVAPTTARKRACSHSRGA